MRPFGRHRHAWFVQDTGVDLLQPLVKPTQRLRSHVDGFRAGDVARARRMAEAADVQLEEGDVIRRLEQRGGLLGGKQKIAPALDHKGWHAHVRRVEDNRAPIDVVLGTAHPRFFRIAAQQIAQPVEHLRGIIRILRVESAGKQPQGVAQLRHVVGRERLIQVGPANDRHDRRQPGYVRAHQLPGQAAAVGNTGDAEPAFARDRDGHGRRITDRPGLHGEDDRLQIIDLIGPGQGHLAVGVAKTAETRRENDVAGVREILGELDSFRIVLAPAESVQHDDDRCGRGRAVGEIHRRIQLDVIRCGRARIAVGRAGSGGGNGDERVVRREGRAVGRQQDTARKDQETPVQSHRAAIHQSHHRHTFVSLLRLWILQLPTRLHNGLTSCHGVNPHHKLTAATSPRGWVGTGRTSHRSPVRRLGELCFALLPH